MLLLSRMIFVNFKTYKEGSGELALSLTRVLEEVSQQTQVKIVPVVQVIDSQAIVSSTTLEVWVQHLDPVSYGPYTGWTLPEEVVRIGIRGVFLNHSEHKFGNLTDLARAVARCKEVDLKTLVFAKDLEELESVVELSPIFAAYEPPELIGRSESSVSSQQPETVARAVESAKTAGIPLVVGAGIHSRDDVKKSLELGAVGVAVSSDIVKADNPKSELLDLTEGFK